MPAAGESLHGEHKSDGQLRMATQGTENALKLHVSTYNYA